MPIPDTIIKQVTQRDRISGIKFRRRFFNNENEQDRVTDLMEEEYDDDSDDKDDDVSMMSHEKEVDDDGNLVKCPECNSKHIQLFSTIKDLKSFLSFISGFMLGTLPFYAKHKYRCEDCNTQFDIK